MFLFRVYLATLTIIVAVYTLIVGQKHGWDLLSIFFADLASLTWPGQFNTDFTCFLSLSAFWLTWRNNMTPSAFVLGVFGFFGGMLFLAPYLFWTSIQAGGDAAVLLLGEKRARKIR
eukprot:TRINITY_DN1942_c0_g1_i1.p1 TRINITY_DN1942_c0_g1~~TRINITY_DN1942_c0_g1_i1.p1  ORF type:complete len:117 (-),score=22.55 TRINITY_DN1942_c0_g1_i1:193-543(-)